MTRRSAVFAHYDKDNIVDDYVMYYLGELQKVAEVIIFVSASPLPLHEIEKVRSLGIQSISEQHDEYDFGSYKRGFFALQNISQYDEIVFCNDSCYGPLSPLESVFGYMNEKRYDFWGVTQNSYDIDSLGNSKIAEMPHIQSYFFVINRKIALSAEFETFLAGVQKEENKTLIIFKYEIGLTKLLSNYTVGSYVRCNDNVNNMSLYDWDRIIYEERCPFLKVEILRDNRLEFDMFGWRGLLKENCSYSCALIERHLDRVRSKLNYKTLTKAYFHYHTIFSIEPWRYVKRYIFSR